MKNKYFLLIILAAFAMVSCGDDDYKTPTIEGEWKFMSRSISSDNIEINNLVNGYLKDDAETIETRRTFKADNTMLSQRYKKGTDVAISRTSYTYGIEDNILTFRQDVSNEEDPIKKAIITVDKDILTAKQELDGEDLANLIVEMGLGIIPFPEGIKVTYTTMEVRQ